MKPHPKMVTLLNGRVKAQDDRISHARRRAGLHAFDIAVCGASGHELRFSNPNSATCPKCRAVKQVMREAAKARFAAVVSGFQVRT